MTRAFALVAALLTAVMFALPTVAQENLDPENTLYMDLSYGRVVIKLRPDLAPNHVARVKELTRKGFYDGTPFHRVIDGFMAQGGDPTGTGLRRLGPARPQGGVHEYALRSRHDRRRAYARPGQRQLAVLHLLRGRGFPRRAVHGVGRSGLGHGIRGHAQARRAGAKPRPHRQDAGRRRREVTGQRKEEDHGG